MICTKDLTTWCTLSHPIPLYGTYPSDSVFRKSVQWLAHGMKFNVTGSIQAPLAMVSRTRLKHHRLSVKREAGLTLLQLLLLAVSLCIIISTFLHLFPEKYEWCKASIFCRVLKHLIFSTANQCDDGKYEANLECVKCPYGTYITEAGHRQCVPCTESEFTVSDGSDTDACIGKLTGKSINHSRVTLCVWL